MRFKRHARFCTLVCSLCALMILSGCGQPAASSMGWTASDNTSDTGEPVAAIPSSSEGGVYLSVATTQKRDPLDNDNKATTNQATAVVSLVKESDPPAKKGVSVSRFDHRPSSTSGPASNSSSTTICWRASVTPRGS
ncbi:MAG: hypothetical protein CM1200mP2_52990 [Planctomycetaceae bacterium]|nr:MAG: hypothetical protein CM1200mP2_52990 [Planctomycetaceae bacterium]